MLSAVRLSTRSLRAFSTSALAASEGAPSGKGADAFNKREKAAEEMYIHEHEVEKLKALAKSIEASKKHLQQLEKDHSALESTVSANEKK